MLGYLKRLVTTGAAYQFGDIVAKALALLTLPLYTRHLSTEAYGVAETLLTAVILASILLRVGVGEAFIRFYFDDQDTARRERIARTATATVAWTTTLASLVAVAFAAPLSRLLLNFNDPQLLDCAVLGLWAFTNLEMAYAQLRVDERARAYMYASGANVALTVAFTIALVVFAEQGARGLLLGNFGASAVVVLGLWWVLRTRVSLAGAAGRPARDAPLRAAHRAGRRERVRAAGGRSLLPVRLLLAQRRRRVRDRDQARHGGVRGGARLPVRVAAARLLDRQRRGSRAAVLGGDHLLRARHRRGGVRGGAARTLDRAPAGRPRVLRRLPRVAVAGARVGALRALPGVRRDRRAARGSPRATTRPGRPVWRSTSCCCWCSCPTAAPASGSPAPAWRCAAPTWRCSWSCTCSPATSSRSASSGGAWRC